MLPNGTVLAHRNDSTATTKKLDSYSAMEELYSFCIENRDSPAVFDVKFYQGLEVLHVASRSLLISMGWLRRTILPSSRLLWIRYSKSTYPSRTLPIGKDSCPVT